MSTPTDDEMVTMHEVRCDGGCGRILGFSDQDRKHDAAALMALFILCQHCVDHPEEIAARMGIDE